MPKTCASECTVGASSPLTKRYGWGVHSNAKGKIAIYPLGSAEYKKHAKNGKLKYLKAMRSSKA
jgi:hypothetical protein